MTVWGYARVSTADQTTEAQRAALLAAGVSSRRLVEDTASGARTTRPGLDWLLYELQPGDELVVWKLDRLGRSLGHLMTTLDELTVRGIGFRSLTEGLDTTTASGRLLTHVVAAMAEFERDLIRERTTAGLAAARASGKTLRHASKATPEQVVLVREMADAGVPQRRITASVGLSRSVVGRIIRHEIASLEGVESDTERLRLYPRTGGADA